MEKARIQPEIEKRKRRPAHKGNLDIPSLLGYDCSEFPKVRLLPGLEMAKKRALIQRKGQLTIPIELRRRYGLEEGSVVDIIDEGDGIKIAPREVVALDALERIGKALKERGISLEEMIEGGRNIGEEIYREKHRPQADDS